MRTMFVGWPSSARSSLVLAASVLALGACGPSPDRVCGHIQGLVDRELPAEEAAKFDVARCIDDVERKRELVGSQASKGVECLLAADSLAAVDDCEREAEETARQAKGGD